MNTKGSSFMLPVDPLRKVVKPRQLNIEPEPSTRLDRQVDRLRRDEDGGGGASPMSLPFGILDVSPDAVTPTIKVRYGTVMDILPTDVDTDILVTDDATTTFYLDATIDDAGDVTAVDLLSGTLPADTTYHAYLLVGTVTAASGVITVINQSLYFSQGFKACDRVLTEGVATTDGTYEFFVR